jgi:hypothetical protein
MNPPGSLHKKKLTHAKTGRALIKIKILPSLRGGEADEANQFQEKTFSRISVSQVKQKILSQ